MGEPEKDAVPGYLKQKGYTITRQMSDDQRRTEQRRIIDFTKDRDWVRTQLMVLGTASSNAIQSGRLEDVDRYVRLAKVFHAVFGFIKDKDDELVRDSRQAKVFDQLEAQIAALEEDSDIRGDLEMWKDKFVRRGQVV